MVTLRKTILSIFGILTGVMAFGQISTNLPEVGKEKIEFSEFLKTKSSKVKHFIEDHPELLIEFKTKLSPADKINLSKKGLLVKDYFGKDIYRAVATASLNKDQFRTMPIKAIGVFSPDIKLSPSLQLALESSTDPELELVIVFYPEIEEAEQNELISKYNSQLLEKKSLKTLAVLKTEKTNLIKLAKEKAIHSIDLYLGKDQHLNHEASINQGVNVLQANNGFGKNLNGAGVVIGVGDGGELGTHLDLQNRVINKADGTYASFGAHTDHVSGTLAGAGNINPNHKGMAPEATLISQKTHEILDNAESYAGQYGMVLTNNSYGANFDCTVSGIYNAYSHVYDQQLYQNPELLHVFAAGNSGWAKCEDYPLGFRTVLPGYQSAKNILTVGSVDDDRNIWASSSRGPTFDGRIKPEICGVGVKLKSMGNNFNYYQSTGTSMAAPAVTGTLALMVEAYRNENNGETPDGALLKTIACNTAEDIGLPGPDFTFGFGLINGKKAVETIEEERYFEGALDEGDSISHVISVPAKVVALKVLLHWRDKEGNIAMHKSLVNDLDLSMYQPSQEKVLPLVLRNEANLVDVAAVPGVDSINNIEQIVLTYPEVGNHEIVVKGREIPFGVQRYYLTYEFVYEELEIIYPLGKEALLPNKYQRIQWEAECTNTASFMLEYSLDNGLTWTLIADNIAADLRSYNWKTPSAFINHAKLRIRKNDGTNIKVTSNQFSILPAPLSFTVAAICEGNIQLDWYSSLSNVNYEIFKFEGDRMVPIETTNTNSIILRNGLTLGEKNWFAVRYIVEDSIYSQRCLAQYAIPEIGAICPWANDLKVKEDKDVVKGRNGTMNSLSNSELIKIPFRNIGNNAINGFNFSYQLNDQAVVSELISTAIPSGDSIMHQFTQTALMNYPDSFRVDYWVSFSSDVNRTNDTIRDALYAIQLENAPISFPFNLELNNTEDRIYRADYIGIEGAEHWDFKNYDNGRLTVDTKEESFLIVAEQDNDSDEVNAELILTLNLSQYIPVNGVKLLFHFENRINTDGGGGLFLSESSNEVWVRGSDQDVWINTSTSLSSEEDWTWIKPVKLEELLANNGQSFSSSTQIKIANNSTKGLEIKSFSVYEYNPLPISLSYFNAERFEDNAQLQWKTDSEQDNAYFEVEHASGSQAANNFETIGRVEGKGTTNEPQYYHFIDRDPNLFATNYYRLKQYDFDGTYTYSAIKAVSFGRSKINALIYPNPAKDYFFIELDSGKEKPATIQLFNSIGKLVWQWESLLELGPNKMKLEVPSNFTAGVYTLRVKVNRELFSYRLSLFD